MPRIILNESYSLARKELETDMRNGLKDVFGNDINHNQIDAMVVTLEG